MDGVFDTVYSPEDHDLPLGYTSADIRKYPAQHYKFRYTEHRHTPKGELKPNPDILQSIIRGVGASVEQCIYLGDSLVKDMAMAIDAGVTSVWAKYGVAQKRPEYELLKEVTHWKDEDVQREKMISNRHVKSSVTLENGFTEIFDHFKFVGAVS